MFHLEYPQRRGFLTWDELGCLARALGFQVDLFKSNVTDEVTVEDDGMKIEEVMKMLDYKLLYKCLHHTVNMHTAEWNMAAIRKCIRLLNHRALKFEELHNIRVAYQLYEAGDMKGMAIDKQTLLRTLKMCNRTIAPMKLMHRLKHMKEDFEERCRIQLNEFLNLVLWCDLYESFDPKEMEYAEGKEDTLFKLVDFERLISHHDQRMAWALDSQYIREEWDFGHETLGSKHMFKDPSVHRERRIKQAKHHKKSYRYLKSEVGHAQKRVYRAHAGYIRPRPITAPQLDMYRMSEAQDKVVETTATEAYESVRRRLRSAPSRTSIPQHIDMSNKPEVAVFSRVAKPKVVSTKDLTEMEEKMDSLKFAITTQESRCQINKEEEMDYYIPRYKEKLANRPPSAPTPEPEPEWQTPTHWSEEIIQKLVYPEPLQQRSHAMKCDARYRGWQQVRTRKGPHHVLVSHVYENSPQEKLFMKMKERTVSYVKHLRSDCLFRYTFKNQVEHGKGQLNDKRPYTAPAAMLSHGKGTDKTNGDKPCLKPSTSKGPCPKVVYDVRRNKSTSGKTFEEDGVGLDGNAEVNTMYIEDFHKILDDGSKTAGPALSASSEKSISDIMEHTNMGKCVETDLGGNRYFKKEFLLEVDPQTEMSTSNWQSGVTGQTEECVLSNQYQKFHEERPVSGLPRSSKLAVGEKQEEEIPVPRMIHSKPKIVEVGQIGKISLLENITESQDLEDKYSHHASQSKEDLSGILCQTKGENETKDKNAETHEHVLSEGKQLETAYTSVPGVVSSLNLHLLIPDQAANPVTKQTDHLGIGETFIGNQYDQSGSRSEARNESENKSENRPVSSKKVHIVEERDFFSKTADLKRGKHKLNHNENKNENGKEISDKSSKSSRDSRRSLEAKLLRKQLHNESNKYMRLLSRGGCRISEDLKLQLMTTGKS